MITGEYDTGKLIEKDGKYIFIPNNISDNETATIYYAGQEGYSSYSDKLEGAVLSSDQIVIIDNNTYTYNQEKMQQSFTDNLNLANSIAQEYGTSVNSLNTIGSSCGARDALKTFAQATMNGETTNACVILGAGTIDYHGTFGVHNPDLELNNGLSGPNWPFLTQEEYQAIEGKTIYIFEGNDAEDWTYVEKLVENGVDVVLVECRSCNHSPLTYEQLTNGIFNFLEDDVSQSFQNEKDYKFKVPNPDYDPTQPESETNQKYIKISYEDAVGRNTGNNFYKIKGLNKYNLVDGTVASDLYQVVEGLNEIKSSISDNASLVSMQQPDIKSTTGVPAGLISCQTSLFSISSDLVNKVDRETQLIAQIAQTMFDMDKDLSNRAGELSGEGGIYNPKVIDEQLRFILNEPQPNFDITFNSFMFEPSSILKSGSTKISMSDINSMFNGTSLIGPLAENLANEKTCAQNSKAAIDSLIDTITSSGNFQGGAWKTVAAKLGSYSNFMQLREQSAQKLEDATIKALKLIKDYMGEYEELDYEELDDLKKELTAIKDLIDSLKNIMTETKLEYYEEKDENGVVISAGYRTVYVYSAAARAQASADLEVAQQQAEEVSKEIAKLEGLPDIIAQAEQIMNDAMSEIYANYGKKVNYVVTGNDISYIPPENTNYVKSDKVYTPETFDYDPESDRGIFKVTRERFENSDRKKAEWGTYEDYVAGVRAKNNPDITESFEDRGKAYDADTSILDNPTQSKPTTPENKEETTIPENKEETTIEGTSNVTSTGKTQTQTGPLGASAQTGASTNGQTSSQLSSTTTSGQSSTPSSGGGGAAPSTSQTTQGSSTTQTNTTNNSTTGSTTTQTSFGSQTDTLTGRGGSPSTESTTPSEPSDQPVEDTTQSEPNNPPTEDTTQNEPSNPPVEDTTTKEHSNSKNETTIINKPSSSTSESANSTKIHTSSKKKNTTTENKMQSSMNNDLKNTIISGPSSNINNTIIMDEQLSEEILQANTDEVISEIPLEEVVGESIEEIPYEENIILESEPIVENTYEEVIDLPQNEEKTEDNSNPLKTAATLAGVGATLGAAGYAGYKYVKSKEEYKEDEEEESEDY